MRFKIFGLFLLVQIFSIGSWQALQPVQQDPLPASAAPGKILSVSKESPPLFLEEEKTKETTLDESYSFYITVKNEQGEYQTLYPLQRQMIEKVLNLLPPAHTMGLKVVLDYDPEAHRGWGGKNLVILAASSMKMEEMIAVLIHEVGHHVDLGVLSASMQNVPEHNEDRNNFLHQSGPSAAFYHLSWSSKSKRRIKDNHLDALSGYGTINPYEDFAESYAFYVLHRASFKELSKTHPVLRQKYDFMRNVVFRGKEFENGLSGAQGAKRPWDVTKLPYSLNTFLLMNGA